jgi:hypothetical protein
VAKAKKRVATRNKRSSKHGKASAKPARKMAASQGGIQRVELNKFYYASIYCPFCGARVVDMEAAASGEAVHTNPCRHTLFIAHDEGLEYRSPRFDENLGLVNVTDEDIDLPEKGIDGLTDEVAMADAIKFASYVGPPSGLGSYVGFAPLEEATG